MNKFYVLLTFSAVICANANLPKIRFEYKYSFKGPHLVQKDRSIPFWEYQGGECKQPTGFVHVYQKYTCTIWCISFMYGLGVVSSHLKVCYSLNGLAADHYYMVILSAIAKSIDKAKKSQ